MDDEELRVWREADRWYTAWLEQAEADRAPWLAGQDIPPDVRRVLATLVSAHAAGELALPAMPPEAVDGEPSPPRNTLAGRRVGAWLLLEEIGRGGMSVVYRAKRDDADSGQVAAVKLLSLGALGASGGVRFETERRLLARLRHPHIATLVDGGFAEDGTPYLAMSLVDGESLTVHCERRALDWRARVGLLVQVCDAVAHAHQNLVVHRDLKPSNILVTAQGVPVLLDFGIAKLLDDTSSDTRTGMRALTPGYAAPEQVVGGPITTATDVHALGVILRRLCAGTGALPADLDAVVAMATRAEPERRYPDARALGEDLVALLQQRPVRAAPDSAGYRLRAFLRRRRGLVVACAGVVAALLGGLGLAVWQAGIASRQAAEAARQGERARAARDFLFTMIAAGDGERSEAVDPPVSEVVARGAAALQDAPPADPELHAEMATLLGHIDTNTGQYDRAAGLLEAALASARRADDPALVANVRVRQGLLANALGEPARALALFEEAIATAEAQAGAGREALLATALPGWSYAMSNLGKDKQAHDRLQALLADTTRVTRTETREALLIAQASVASDPADRLALLEQVRQHYATHATTPLDRLNLAIMLGNTLGQLRRFPDAITQLEAAVAQADRVYPGNSTRRARVYNNLGIVYAGGSRMGDANRAYGIAEGIHRAVGDERSPAFASLLHNRGVLLRDLGDAETGVPLIEQAHALALAQFGPEDRRTVIALRNLAYARAEAGRDPRAERDWQQAHRSASALIARDRYDVLLVGAHVASQLGDARAARERSDSARTLAESGQFPVSMPQRIRSHTIEAVARSLAGDAVGALALFERADAEARADPEESWSARWRNHVALATHLARHARTDAAREHAAHALALLEARGPGLDSRLRRDLRALAGTGATK